MSLGVLEKNGKFIVARDNQPILLPKSDGQKIVTEFSSREDAEKYMKILSSLEKQKKSKKQTNGR